MENVREESLVAINNVGGGRETCDLNMARHIQFLGPQLTYSIRRPTISYLFYFSKISYLLSLKILDATLLKNKNIFVCKHIKNFG